MEHSCDFQHDGVSNNVTKPLLNDRLSRNLPDNDINLRDHENFQSSTKSLSPSNGRKNFWDQVQNSWKKTKNFAHSQTDVLSTYSTVEVINDDNSAKCSNTQTLMNLIKGETGAGVLTLPMAFKNGGLWVGFAGTILISLIAVHCVHILANISEKLEKRTGVHIRHLEDLVESCFLNGPRRLKKLSSCMRKFVHYVVQILQCSFCCFYIMFVASNCQKILSQVWTNSPSVRVYEVMVFLILLPLGLIQNLRTLAIFSTLGNFCFLLSMVVIYQFLLQDLPDASNLPAFNSWSTLPLFFGTTISAYEGIGLIIPIRHRMKYPSEYNGFSGVLNMGIVITVVNNIACGFYGYLKFGDDVSSTLSLNLPHEQWLYLSVDVMFMMVASVSCVIQFYVPVNALWPSVEEKLKSVKYKMVAEYGFRLALFSAILFVAIVIPHIDLFLSLTGAFLGTLVIMILPITLDTLIRYEDGELTVLAIVKNTGIALCGIVGFVTGTYTSIQEIINTF